VDVVDVSGLRSERSLTIPEFCFVENISKATFYKLRKLGLAPALTRILDAIRITAQARRDWHAKLHLMQVADAAALLAARKQQQTVQAGKLAAASPLHVSNRTRRKSPDARRRRRRR